MTVIKVSLSKKNTSRTLFSQHYKIKTGAAQFGAVKQKKDVS